MNDMAELYEQLGEVRNVLQKNLNRAGKDDTWLRYRVHLEGKIAGINISRSYVQQMIQRRSKVSAICV